MNNNAVGTACPSLSENRPCNTHACDQDCVVGDWTDWQNCSVPCGGGIRVRTREIAVAKAGEGAPCETLLTDEPCNMHACPIDPSDCNLGDWSPWGECSKPCGGGEHVRVRDVPSEPSCAGVPNVDFGTCNSHGCAYDPQLLAEKGLPAVYTVTYTTGPFSNAEGKNGDGSGSNEQVYIKLIGPLGASEWQLLGEYFVANTTSDVEVTLEEHIGELSEMELKITTQSLDTWDVVNFMNIRTPSQQTVQFRMDTDQHRGGISFRVELNTGTEIDESNYGVPVAHMLFRTTAHPMHPGEEQVINVEETVTPAISQWQLHLPTAKDDPHAFAGTLDTVFVQITGTYGYSRFYPVGKAGLPSGGSHVEWLSITEDIGEPISITLEAGGLDAWHCKGSVVFEDPTLKSSVYKADCDVWLAHAGSTEVLATGASVVDRVTLELSTSPTVVTIPMSDEQAALLQAMGGYDNMPGWNGLSGPLAGPPHEPTQKPTPKPTPPLPHWAHIEALLQAMINPELEDVTHNPTPTPTQFPTRAMGSCPYGPYEHKPSGWHGPGFGNNYCNLCVCTDGALECTHDECGVPLETGNLSFSHIYGTQITTKHVCSHIECSFSGSGTTSGMKVEVAHHHLEERGSSHHCGYNYFSGACTCYCFGTPFQNKYPALYNAAPLVQRLVQSVPLSLPMFNGEVTCHNQTFLGSDGLARRFDPLKGPVRVIVSMEADSDLLPVSVWVDAVTDTTFNLCAALTEMGAGAGSKRSVRVNYLAWQPSVGLWSSQVRSGMSFRDVPVNPPGREDSTHALTRGEDCHHVYFPEIDGTAAGPTVIIGSVGYKAKPTETEASASTVAANTRALAMPIANSFLANFDSVGLLYCVQAEDPAHGSAILAFNSTVRAEYNWIAFTAATGISNGNYLAAGVTGSHSSAWTALKASPGHFENCRLVTLGSPSSEPPIVLASFVAKHGSLDWARGVYGDIIQPSTTVRSVTTAGFELCSVVQATSLWNARSVYAHMSWSWVAFSSPVAIAPNPVESQDEVVEP